MRVGIATDHGGFGLKEELLNTLKAAGDEVVDFGAHALSDEDSYPDGMLPLARTVIVGHAEHGIAIRAALIHDHFSAKQGVQDDHLNILCMGARAVGLWWPGIWWTAF